MKITVITKIMEEGANTIRILIMIHMEIMAEVNMSLSKI